MKITLKTILLTLTIVGSVNIAYCQTKVVESSAKKAPKWLGVTAQDFIITSAIKPDLESAKNQCLDNVKMNIIDAVAQNVRFSTTSTINQSSSNEGITDFSDKFASELKTQAANVPYIRGVSLSKVADSYWEKRVDKKTKQESYLYTIKYPFPSVELKKLVYEFEKQDKDMYNKYLELEQQITKVASVEEISRNITALTPLINYFFDDVRKTAAKSLQGAYTKLFDGITIEELSSKPGEARLAFMLEGRVITTSQRPIIKSECATNITYKHQDNQYVVTYDYDYCDKDKLNQISLAFRIYNRPITHKINFKVVDNTPKIYANGEIYITADTVNAEYVSGITFRVNIKSENCQQLVIDQFLFNIPGITGAIVIPELNITLTADGEHAVVVKYEGKLPISSGHKGLYNQSVGYFKGRMGTDASPFNIRFVQPFKSNW